LLSFDVVDGFNIAKNNKIENKKRTLERVIHLFSKKIILINQI